MNQARVAALLLLTMRGTPTLYYGDELGMMDGVIPTEFLQDPQGLRLGAEYSRDVGRTPMQWNSSPNAGFSSKKPWLPVSADFTVRNVAVQNDDPTSILSLYRRLIWYRKASPALVVGRFCAVDPGNDDCLVYRRDHPAGQCMIALNFSGNSHRISLSEPKNGHLVLSTYLDRNETVSLTNLQLRPHEGTIIELNL